MTKRSLDLILHKYFQFGFHLSRSTWDWLEISTLISSPDKAGASSEAYSIRQLADRFNERCSGNSRWMEHIKAGQFISVGVIIDVLRYLIILYSRDENPGVIPRGLDWVISQRGQTIAKQPPISFVNLFPPLPVMRGELTEKEFLQNFSGTPDNQETVVDEIILLYISMLNPAFKPFQILFDDNDLKRQSPYIPLVINLESFFSGQPAFRPLGMTLFQCLRAPILASPDSLEGQLNYIKKHWSKFLPDDLLDRLLLAADIIKEEQRQRGLGPGPNLALQFATHSLPDDYNYSESARFSRDADWMSNVVLIAKSVYVWLDQLSKKYRRHIKFLSEIPDEELDLLARWGFTGLWLIGIWERSPASQKIKQIMGNPEAAPSAYSLYDYVIAEDLGGETGFQNLRERAWHRGIRLASDMVPNHMGIYSKWVIEHPNWFIQLNYPPYPSYQFNGVDLSWDSRITLQIEDGYWDRRDAAVVFKRIDKWTGDVRYIYHGNDGTSMPWNDTAQLNFTMPEVREAVIQTILHVARQTPIIRFDAAMTLAKKHYQRLWFPPHGHGGAIPSRAEHGLSRTDFDAIFPVEFWREVVDRVAAEAPDTLLLAEAFWLMEGYFVRTLGMHRVYNSAFMNMLKMEDNGKYRTTVRNVLEFSPEVLKRFVNFMNNPDELTALEQFGKGDKYFGAAIMMVTMPGLPMFGHGQIEGFAEKYGMEYRKAYWDEPVDQDLVRRHESEIFPLMRRRRLFSGAQNFAFYDFITPEGWVDENVFAYSNRADDERAIIIYNNAYNTTRGRIHTSTPINIGSDANDFLVRRTLADALGLNTEERYFYTFRDYRTRLEYVRAGKQIADEGLYAVMNAYQYHAFLDFREIFDSDGSWGKLSGMLNGRGVENLEETYQKMQLDPILIPFREVLNADLLRSLTANKQEAQASFNEKTLRFFVAVRGFAGKGADPEMALRNIIDEMDALPIEIKTNKSHANERLTAEFLSQISRGQYSSLIPVAYSWIIVHQLGQFLSTVDTASPEVLCGFHLENWMLRKTISEFLAGYYGDNGLAHFDALLVSILASHRNLLLPSPDSTLSKDFKALSENSYAIEFLQINRHQETLWLNREQLEKLINALLLVTYIQLRVRGNLNDAALKAPVQAARKIIAAAKDASYQVGRTIELLSLSRK